MQSPLRDGKQLPKALLRDRQSLAQFPDARKSNSVSDKIRHLCVVFNVTFPQLSDAVLRLLLLDRNIFFLSKRQILD